MSKRKLGPGSLRDRVILIFFAMLVVPFLLFAYYSHVKAIEGISNANNITSFSYLMQARKNFETYLTRLNDQVNDLIGNQQLQGLLEQLAEDPADEGLVTVNILSLMNQRTSTIDAFRVHLYPADPVRYPIYMSTVGGGSRQITEQNWFKKISVSSTPTWELSMPQTGQYAKPLLLYVKRFTGLYDNVPRGIMVVDLSEDQLGRFFNPPNFIEGQKILLLDEERNVIYDSSANEWTGRPEMSGKFRKLVVGNTEEAQTIAIGGQKYLASSLKLDSRSWYVVNLAPLGALTGSILEINQVMLLFLIVYLICCMGVVYYLTAHFTQPVAKLVQLMRRAERGQLRHQTASWSKRGDEVGWLYQGFDSLTGQIERLVEEAARSELKKRELELQVLSHQINPHFLYNTLESIRWKAETHGRNDIGEMVAALGNLLRLSLNQGKEITTLRREIEQVKAYVQIEQARMGKTIRISYAIDPELLPLPFLRLLLQPLVENAIRHSIQGNFDQGKILISAQRDKGDIVIRIIDNGGGIPPEVLGKLNRQTSEDGQAQPQQSTGSKGVGLRNINERLRLNYGDAYRLRIESGPGEGTCIILRHPVIGERQRMEA
ncbi:sensor histidine kinase [Paenibacillus macerans]|uniref:sensor histidine kinase n=1 Tax=Paenibacillus macerans TaxID=44252 RepID=UPI003D316F57